MTREEYYNIIGDLVFPQSQNFGTKTVGCFEITKRELFAVMAMQWLISNRQHDLVSQDDIIEQQRILVNNSIWFADRLIEELNK